MGKLPPLYEFAELLCGKRELANAETGELHPYFTIQLLAFPCPPTEAMPDRVALPQVLVSPHQFDHLLEAIQTALEKYFPERAQTRASDAGSGTPTVQ